jgi:adenylate cyclase
MPRRSLRHRSSIQVPASQAVGVASAWQRWGVNLHWPAALTGRGSSESACVTRLMAAVQTDVAGYSRLFALDDTGTVARLRQLRRDWIRPAIDHHQGLLVQTAGDSMLIIFDSVAQAVRCAVAIQHGLALDNENWPEDRRIGLRIGIDLGDIIMDGMDFHGDGVIIAARLQTMCPPGGVCISRAVHERGGHRLGLRCEALGPLTLKNIARPVDAFVLWPSHQEATQVVRIKYPAMT